MNKTPKNSKELDKWIKENPRQDKNGPYLMSRYRALVFLFGQVKADKIMRDIEASSWKL